MRVVFAGFGKAILSTHIVLAITISGSKPASDFVHCPASSLIALPFGWHCGSAPPERPHRRQPDGKYARRR
jgi:hypothetical protein